MLARFKTYKARDRKLSRERDIKTKSRLVSFLKKLTASSKKRDSGSEVSYSYLMELWNKQHGLCAVTGVPMTHIQGEGRVDTNLSLDRIDSDVGYRLNNLQLVCDKVNIMKNAGSMENLVYWASLIVANLRKREAA